MEIWWSSLSSFEKVLWCMAIPTSLIFILQSILTFMGMDGDSGLEADADGNLNEGDGPFQLFTFRNFINFFLGFGWAGITLLPYIENKLVLSLVAFAFGCFLVFLVMYIFYKISGLTESGTMNINNALHQDAEVYLVIPGNRAGKGKVFVRIQGALREVDAITDGDRIPTGSNVTVTGILNNETLIVNKN